MALLLLGNSGQLMVGLLLRSDYGLRGALLGSVAHALALSLVLPGVMLLEQAGGGSWRREPVATAALLLGLSGLIGVPPLPGWYAKIELWYAAREQSVLLPWLIGVGQTLLVVGAARLALLRPEPLPTGRAGDRHTVGRGGLLPRALLLLLIGGVLLSGFGVGSLIDRVGAATVDRAQFFGVAR
jgi:formate hydrogenlyase subunit 3/multisubunit Na+/H+ antiporter MnhD subunit